MSIDSPERTQIAAVVALLRALNVRASVFESQVGYGVKITLDDDTTIAWAQNPDERCWAYTVLSHAGEMTEFDRVLDLPIAALPETIAAKILSVNYRTAPKPKPLTAPDLSSTKRRMIVVEWDGDDRPKSFLSGICDSIMEWVTREGYDNVAVEMTPCSTPVCVQHGSVLTDEEAERVERGEDPCVYVRRV